MHNKRQKKWDCGQFSQQNLVNWRRFLLQGVLIGLNKGSNIVLIAKRTRRDAKKKKGNYNNIRCNLVCCVFFWQGCVLRIASSKQSCETYKN